MPLAAADELLWNNIENVSLYTTSECDAVYCVCVRVEDQPNHIVKLQYISNTFWSGFGLYGYGCW